MATAVTYRTSECATKLRTVVMDNVRDSVVLLPTGRMDVVLGNLLHGTTCAHEFWDGVLDTQGDGFLLPTSQVVQRREVHVAVKVRHKLESA